MICEMVMRLNRKILLLASVLGQPGLNLVIIIISIHAHHLYMRTGNMHTWCQPFAYYLLPSRCKLTEWKHIMFGNTQPPRDLESPLVEGFDAQHNRPAAYGLECYGK